MKVKKILITRTDRLGDVVLSTPVIRFMREKYPNAHIAFMVKPENRDVVSGNPHLDEVIIYDKRGIHESFLSTVKFALELRKRKFDMAIALHPTNRAHIIFFLAKIPVRIGYNRKMARLLTKRIEHTKQEGVKHEVDYNFDFLKKAGFNVERAHRKPYILTTSNEKRLIDATLEGQGIGKDIIAIHVGASCPSKRWPIERFARAADILKEKHKLDIAFVGSDETVEYSALAISKMKQKAFDLTGLFLVGELAEFLSRCKLLISNDSGPVHVAVAMLTPVVDIFGRGDPGLSYKRWGPLGDHDIVLHKDVGCEVCQAHNCRLNFACIKRITVEEVVSAAEKILGPAD